MRLKKQINKKGISLAKKSKSNQTPINIHNQKISEIQIVLEEEIEQEFPSIHKGEKFYGEVEFFKLSEQVIIMADFTDCDTGNNQDKKIEEENEYYNEEIYDIIIEEIDETYRTNQNLQKSYNEMNFDEFQQIKNENEKIENFEEQIYNKVGYFLTKIMKNLITMNILLQTQMHLYYNNTKSMVLFNPIMNIKPILLNLNKLIQSSQVTPQYCLFCQCLSSCIIFNIKLKQFSTESKT